MPTATRRPRPAPLARWRPIVDQSLHLNGTTDRVTFADPPQVPDSNVDFSIEVVFKFNSAGSFADILNKATGDTNGWYIQLGQFTSTLNFVINGNVDLTSTMEVFPGDWIYLCVTHEATANVAKMYVGAITAQSTSGYSVDSIPELEDTNNAPTNPTTNNQALEIGTNSSWLTSIDLNVAWVRIWKKVLQQQDVNELWLLRMMLGDVIPQGLVFWWDAANPRRDLVSGLGGTFNGTVELSSTYGYPHYFISQRDRRHNLPLLSIEASGAASATGAPSLPFFNAAGTGVQTQSSSGAASLPKLNAAGQAVMLPSATGTPSLPFINTAGVAVQTQAATGTPSLPFLSAAGAATFGTAAAGSGTPSLPFLNVAGVAVMVPSATGAPSLPFLSAAGSALHTQAASGAPALPFMTAAGVAVFGSAAAASGTPSLPFINTVGVAVQTQSASGTPSLPFLSVAGVAVFGSAASGSGTPNLPRLNAAGVGVQTQAATGTPSLPFMTAAGVAVQVPKATGAVTLPFLSAAGSAAVAVQPSASGAASLPFFNAAGVAAVRYTATGAANLPRLGAAGSAFFGDALGVIAEALARWAPVVSADARYARDATASARNE